MLCKAFRPWWLKAQAMTVNQLPPFFFLSYFYPFWILLCAASNRPREQMSSLSRLRASAAACKPSSRAIWNDRCYACSRSTWNSYPLNRNLLFHLFSIFELMLLLLFRFPYFDTIWMEPTTCVLCLNINVYNSFLSSCEPNMVIIFSSSSSSFWFVHKWTCVWIVWRSFVSMA